MSTRRSLDIYIKPGTFTITSTSIDRNVLTELRPEVISIAMLFSFVIATVLVSSTIGSRCPDGYAYFAGDDTCVRGGGDDQTYAGARKTCQDEGGDLVKITSLAKSNLVYDLVDNDNDIWIGVEDITDEGTYTYYDGSALTYEKWDSNEPNNLNNEDCTHLIGAKKNLWNDNNCDKEFDFACETAPRTRKPECGDGWEHNEDADVCIKVVNDEKADFYGARAHCQKEGGDLVTMLNNKNEKDFVKTLLNKKVYYWIGISSPEQKVDLKFVNGNELKFRRGQRSVRICIQMKNDKWLDRPCGKRIRFVCQKDRA